MSNVNCLPSVYGLLSVYAHSLGILVTSTIITRYIYTLLQVLRYLFAKMNNGNKIPKVKAELEDQKAIENGLIIADYSN